MYLKSAGRIRLEARICRPERDLSSLDPPDSQGLLEHISQPDIRQCTFFRMTSFQRKDG